MGLYAIFQAQSTDPWAIASVPSSIDMETIVGPVALINGTRHFYRPYYGEQVVDINNTLNINYPYTYPDVKPVLYPWNESIW